mgnify:CR=1 FL=1
MLNLQEAKNGIFNATEIFSPNHPNETKYAILSALNSAQLRLFTES